MKSGQVRSSIADVATGAKQNGAGRHRMRGPGWQTLRRAGAIAGTAMLVGCVGGFVWCSRHWPLVNDAALMHYVVLLMQRGMAPYREIGDFNLPGAYAPEWVSTALAGRLHVSEAAMWRGMDAGVLVLSGWAMVRMARPYSWFAGVFAGALFALYHGRDGIGQAGQRDLWMTMLALWATALLFAAMRSGGLREQTWRVGCAGLLLGAAVTIKPFGGGYLLCLLPLLVWQKRGRVWLVAWAGAGFALPLFGVWLFLLRWHAVGAFWRVLRVDLPYHARLADGSVLQLLGASSVPSVVELLCLLVAAAITTGGWRAGWAALRARPHEQGGWAASPERLLLVLCVVLGLVSFVAQGKGFPYQRYPYVGFLWLLAALEFTAAVRSERRAARAIGAAGFAFGVLVCAPAYLGAAARAHWPTPVMQAMERALIKQTVRQAGAGGVSGPSGLDGSVQCIDAVSGCTDALLHLHLRQATGTMYDELLFPQTPAPWGTRYSGPAPGAPVPAAVRAGQQRFQAALLAHPPRVLLVSAWLFLEGPGEYRKLALWPWFAAYLAEHYTLESQQDFARAENGPMGFRVYVQRAAAFR